MRTGRGGSPEQKAGGGGGGDACSARGGGAPEAGIGQQNATACFFSN